MSMNNRNTTINSINDYNNKVGTAIIGLAIITDIANDINFTNCNGYYTYGEILPIQYIYASVN